MDLLDILRVVRRRWLVALIALISGGVLLVAATAVVEPDWDGNLQLVLQGPFEVLTTDDLGQEQIVALNRLLGDGEGSFAIEILWRRATSQEVKTSFADAGLSTDYTIDFEPRRPFMSLAVTDSDPNRVAATLDSLVDFFELELATRQDATNIDMSSRVTVEVLSETEIAANLTSRRRAQGVLFVLALVGAVVAATGADILIQRRTLHGEDDEPAEATEHPDGSLSAAVETALPNGAGAEAAPREAPSRWTRESATDPSDSELTSTRSDT